MTIIQAIAKMEGFGAAINNIPTRCNNPGDIIAGEFANAHGAIPDAPDPLSPSGPPFRFAVFPDAETGWNALRALLVIDYAGMTITAAINKYAPPNENNTSGYADFICTECLLAPETMLTVENIG